jgi:hypothetical protein
MEFTLLRKKKLSVNEKSNPIFCSIMTPRSYFTSGSGALRRIKPFCIAKLSNLLFFNGATAENVGKKSLLNSISKGVLIIISEWFSPFKISKENTEWVKIIKVIKIMFYS